MYCSCISIKEPHRRQIAANSVMTLSIEARATINTQERSKQATEVSRKVTMYSRLKDKLFNEMLVKGETSCDSRASLTETAPNQVKLKASAPPIWAQNRTLH